MRWKSKAAQPLNEWHRWFAWHPIRIPADRFLAGNRIWLETVERYYQFYMGGDYTIHYREVTK